MSLNFNEFKDTSLSQWLTKIEADLKGSNSLDYFKYSLGEELNVSPFLTESLTLVESPLTYNKINIGTDIRLESDKAINQSALFLLQSGVDVLRLSFNANSDPEIILKDIDPRYLKIILNLKNCGLNKIKSINAKINQIYPEFKDRFLTELPDESILNDENIKDVVFSVRVQQNFLTPLAELKTKIDGYSAHSPDSKFYFFISISTLIPGSIAFLRALRIMLIRFGISEHSNICLFPDMDKLSENQHIKLIQMSYLSFIAMSGGADVQFGLPVANEHDIEHARLSINMAHIYREEAKLDKVTDPFAGSYFIEKATSDLLTQINV